MLRPRKHDVCYSTTGSDASIVPVFASPRLICTIRRWQRTYGYGWIEASSVQLAKTILPLLPSLVRSTEQVRTGESPHFKAFFAGSG